MPRRSARQVVSAVPAQEPEPTSAPILEGPDANLCSLRRNWKWAAFAQFFYIFYDLFAISDISVSDIENDLVYGTNAFIPRIMQRLLFTLTYDRKISLENWQNAMRKQYDKRDPHANLLGPPLIATTSHSRQSPSAPVEEVPKKLTNSLEDDEKVEAESVNGLVSGPPSTRQETEEPPSVEQLQEHEEGNSTPQTVDWSELSMDQKLDAMHTLTEWQFQNPLRLRQIMKSDDELASWRSEPVGYDKLQNAYWLIGGNRLWIQRAPPKSANKKRKRKESPAKKGKASAKQKPAKRRKTQATAEYISKASQPATPNSRSRAAKEQAKAKLDAQAKALAEFQRQQTTQSSSGRSVRSTRGTKAAAPEPPKPSGTRTSSRLRHLQDDGWEQVPDEWLESDSQKPSTRSSKHARTGLESDYDESASELTELSEDEEDEEEEQQQEDEEEEEKVKSPTPDPEPQADFVEWETLCVTLADWEAFPLQFAQATHYTERAFYKYLTTALVPEVTAELKAIEAKRRMEEALNTRKRSSRLAVRESEKEAVRLAAQKKAEEDAQNARTRRLEARLHREQEERDRREKEREERRAAREARVAQRGVSVPSDKDEEPQEKSVEPPAPQANGKGKSKGTSGRSRAKASGKSTPSNEDWELDCEVCGRHGKNLDDDVPLMSCGSCSRWQHIQCHDKLDASQGRRKRDWNKIDFICKHCLSRRYAQPIAPQPPSHYAQRQQQQPATAVYSYPSQGWQQNGAYPSQHVQPQPPRPDAYRSMGQTSSVRSSAYPAHPQTYSNGQTGAISFSHYQPQAGGFAADPHRGQQQQPYNPYTRTTNGSWTADTMKYQSYATQPQTQPSWSHGSYAPASYVAPSQQPPSAPAPSSSSPIPPASYPYDTSYQRGSTYDHPQHSAVSTAPTRDGYAPIHYPGYAQPQNPSPVQQQPYSHSRAAYPPQQ